MQVILVCGLDIDYAATQITDIFSTENRSTLILSTIVHLYPLSPFGVFLSPRFLRQSSYCIEQNWEEKLQLKSLVKRLVIEIFTTEHYF